MFNCVINWKTVASIGASVIGIILATRVDKDKAVDALESLAQVMFASTKVIDKLAD